MLVTHTVVLDASTASKTDLLVFRTGMVCKKKDVHILRVTIVYSG